MEAIQTDRTPNFYFMQYEPRYTASGQRESWHYELSELL